MCVWQNVLVTLLVLSSKMKSNAAPRIRFNHECKQPRGDVCIEIRKCPYFQELLDSTRIPRPRHVIKEIREQQCGFMANVPKVCCTLPKVSTALPMTAVVSIKTKSAFLGADVKALSNPPDVTSHKNVHLLPNKDTCGLIGNNFRITGGSETTPGEFPWMALIAYMTKDGVDFRCGGSLINNRYVLTAAHCVLNMTMVGIRLGEHNIYQRRDCDDSTGKCAPPVQDFYIEDLIVHKNYVPSTFTNDIALIRLATPANFTFSVQPICLPMGDLATYNLDQKYATVSGWGVTETGYKSAELLKISVPVISFNDCHRIYQEYTPITEKQICAGGLHGRDSCGGDSGGPLIHVNLLDGSPRYVQHGIVSYGPRHCGTEGQPGVYTKVASYMDWILDNMRL